MAKKKPGGLKPKRKPKAKRKPKPIPSPETVVESSVIVSPKGNVYKVLRTNQADPYDPPRKASKSAKRQRRPPDK